MPKVYSVLILGASYGALLGTKMALAGHKVTLVCLPEEADLINSKGQTVRMPIRGRDGLVEIHTSSATGELSAAIPGDVNPDAYDLIGLAMQEPQYSSPGVRELLDAIVASGKPTMSIMNMPPLPFLKRIPGLDYGQLEQCYTDHTVWASFDPNVFTLASPDPQAFRPPEEPTNILQVSLPTNFKVARFESDAHTKILRDIQRDIEAIRFDCGDGDLIELPVKLKVHDSVFVPLAKWAMLITGNYRCIRADGPQAIKDAVHTQIEVSNAVYEWVSALCVTIGASPDDMVPFEKYANAAQGLAKPSSAARALFGGAPNIERVDCLVKTIATQKGMHNESVEQTVKNVDTRLEMNRSKA